MKMIDAPVLHVNGDHPEVRDGVGWGGGGIEGGKDGG